MKITVNDGEVLTDKVIKMLIRTMLKNTKNKGLKFTITKDSKIELEDIVLAD